MPRPEKPRASRPPRPPRKPLAAWKLALFSSVTVLFLLALTEASLRLAGFGGMPHLFEPVVIIGGDTIYRSSNRPLWPYFGNSFKGGVRLVGSTVDERVVMPKPRDVVRVVILGESTVQGFPYPPNLCAAAFLQRYLQERMPGRRVEVINTGVTAIASYPLRFIADESLSISPDLLVVYAGHNEYFGAFGVASSQGVGTHPWQMALALWIRQQGIPQAAQRLIRALPNLEGGSELSGRAGLMTLMSAREFIAPDDVLRRRAEESLAANIGYVARKAREAKVPVLLCSLTANEGGMQPVRSMPPPAAVKDGFDAAMQRGRDRLTSHPAEAAQEFQRAAALAPQSALPHFLLGRALAAEGRTTGALAAFRLARDLDAMPWRATSRFNEVLRDVAKRDDLPFCDVDAAFHDAAGGAPGWRFFVDHLHPALEGQALMGWSICEQIRRSRLLDVREMPRGDWRTAARGLGENILVHLVAAQRMKNLFGVPPLDNDAASREHWEAETDRIAGSAQPFERRAAARYLTELATLGTARSFSFTGGLEALSERKLTEAGAYFRCAMVESPQFSNNRLIAVYYSNFVSRRMDRFGPVQRREVEEAVDEALLTEKATKSDRTFLMHALAGLYLLLDNAPESARWAARIPKDSWSAKSLAYERKLITGK